MPHQSFKIIPGVDQNKTLALNEAAISISQLIRFIPDRTMGGLVQKLGGWSRFFPNTITSIVRCLWAWEDTNAYSYLAVGAEGVPAITITNVSGNGTTVTITFLGTYSFPNGTQITVSGVNPATYNGAYVVTGSTANTVSFASAVTTAYVSGGYINGGGTLQVIESGGAIDITPQKTIANVAVNFATVAGSNEITVTDTGRNADSYDVVDIQTQVSVGGLVLFGQYQVFNPGASPNTYKIYATNILGERANATFTTLTSPISVTGASFTATSITLNYAGPYTFVVGQAIVVSGVVASGPNPNGYNGTYIVTNSTSTSVTYDNTTNAARLSGGTINDRGAVPKFNTTNTSDFVDVTLANHGYFVGDTFPVLVSTSVGGVTLYGNFIVVSVASASVFRISASTSATSDANALMNAGNARLVYYNGIGPLPPGSGYGILGYGEGGYGTGTEPISGTGIPINAVDWTMDNWGEVLIACPLDGPIYRWNPTSGDPVALNIPNAPPVNEGMFVAMPQRQIVAWGSTFTGIKDPLLIRWCEVNDYDQWIGTVVNQAGSYRIPKGSRIVQCIQGPQQGLVWTDLGCWSMQYAGPPYVYQFNEIGTGCGLIGRKAAASVNGIVYWMGPSQFFRLSGSGVEPIRCPVWDVVFQDLDINNLDKIRVAPNSRFGEITWYFPTITNGGENEGYVKYNFILDQWDYGFDSDANPYVARSAWINESVLGPPIGAGLNQVIFQHETSPDADGVPMNSFFQTGYFALSEADVKMFIDQVWPDMKWGYFGGAQGANINMTFYVTDYPGQPAIEYGPFVLTQETTFITPRFRGRLVSIRIDSNDIDSFWRLGNFRYRLQPDGRF